LDGNENDLKKMNIKGWRKISWARDALKLTVKDAKVLPRLYRQWIKEK